LLIASAFKAPGFTKIKLHTFLLGQIWLKLSQFQLFNFHKIKLKIDAKTTLSAQQSKINRLNEIKYSKNDNNVRGNNDNC